MTKALKILKEYLTPSVEVRVVPSCPNYAVSEDGRVFDIGTYPPGETVQYLLGEHAMAYLYTDGWISHFVHHLVMEAFGEWLRAEGLEIHHIDANPLNNHISNLRWITHSENVGEGWKLRANRKLTNEEAAFAKGLLTLPGLDCREVAKMLSLGPCPPSVETVRSIEEGTSYTDVEPEF